MMSAKITAPLLQTISLGVLAGMRTFSAPATASYILSRRNSGALNNSPLNFMQRKTATAILALLAAAELAGDKNPSAPNRTGAGGLIGRTIAGALAGASIYKAAGHKALTGALIGGVAASAATFASFNARKQVVELTGYADPYIGAGEDLLVIAGAAALIKTA